jgi:hypothetical protein
LDTIYLHGAIDTEVRLVEQTAVHMAMSMEISTTEAIVVKI